MTLIFCNWDRSASIFGRICKRAEIPYVRSSAAKVLGEIKPTDRETLQAITSLLQHPDSVVHDSAFEALEEIKPNDPEIHRALVQTLQDKDARVCKSAAIALGNIKPKDPAVRAEALSALKQLGSQYSEDVRDAARRAIDAILGTEGN